MKTMHQFLMIIVVLVSAISCDNAEKKDPTNTPKSVSKETTSSNDDQLSLNDGKRWVANQETTEGVNNMIGLIDSFTDKDNLSSYPVLTKSLKSEFSMIFKKCTMKGASHDQLHNFLYPMKAMFKQLSSNDLNECKTAYDELNKHLAGYKDFFE